VSRLEPIALEGRVVRLEPLSMTHLDELAATGLDPDLWRLTVSQVSSHEDLAEWIATALDERAAGTALPFVIRERITGRVAGSTRFGAYSARHRRVEIGWTWVGVPWQRTAINTETKYLLLRHAFEHLHLLRVEFKTDVLNVRSREAILRLGAREEGILRRHQVTDSGRIRDSVYYAITDADWPVVRAGLEQRLGASHRSP
jgi:RimJ/RimL family protein N-acetyltransferase